MNKENYIVVTDTELHSLIAAVNVYLKDNYIPTGGIAISVSNENQIVYYQSIVRREYSK